MSLQTRKTIETHKENLCQGPQKQGRQLINKRKSLSRFLQARKTIDPQKKIFVKVPSNQEDN